MRDMINPEFWTPDDTLKSFYSPLTEDLVVSYRNDDNKIEYYTIRSKKISTYPTYKADNFIEHVLEALIEERKLGYLTAQERENLRKEIDEHTGTDRAADSGAEQ